MPDRTEEQKWSRKMVGIETHLDISMGKLTKAEAVAKYHRFFLHQGENEIDGGILSEFKASIDKVLSKAEIKRICEAHKKLATHNY